VIVRCTPAQQAEAAGYANAIVATGLAQRQNYSGPSNRVFQRYYPGYLGEIVFRAWLDAEGLRYIHRIRTDGHSDGHEFLLWHRGLCYTGDVKVNGLQRKEFLLDAGKPVSARFWIACQYLWPDSIELRGWLSQQQVLDLPIEQRYRLDGSAWNARHIDDPPRTLEALALLLDCGPGSIVRHQSLQSGVMPLG
jgi:hypothetical protein